MYNAASSFRLRHWRKLVIPGMLSAEQYRTWQQKVISIILGTGVAMRGKEYAYRPSLLCTSASNAAVSVITIGHVGARCLPKTTYRLPVPSQ